MSGVDIGGSWVRKGAVNSILSYLNSPETSVTPGGAVRLLQAAVSAEAIREINDFADQIAKTGGTPLAVAQDGKLLGIIRL